MNKVFILCEIRHIEIPCAESVLFIKECNQQGVHPSGGTVKNGQISYTLPNPVSKEEATVIFKEKGHGGELDLIEKLGAFKALVSLDLL